MSDMNWQEDIKINPTNLLESMWKQTDIFAKYAKPYADALSEKQRLTRAIKLAEADVELEIRQDPTNFGLDEYPKEAAFKAAVQQDDRIRELNDQLLACQRDVNLWGQAVAGCDHRRSMLKYMTELISKQVFSVPDFVDSHKMKKQKEVLREQAHLSALQKGNTDATK